MRTVLQNCAVSCLRFSREHAQKRQSKKGLNVYLIIKLFPESYKSVENEDDELGIRLLLYNSTHA